MAQSSGSTPPTLRPTSACARSSTEQEPPLSASEIEGEAANGREQQGAYQRPPCVRTGPRRRGSAPMPAMSKSRPTARNRPDPVRATPANGNRAHSLAGHAILEEIDRPALPERIEHLKTYGRAGEDQPRPVVQQVAQRDQHRHGVPSAPAGPARVCVENVTKKSTTATPATTATAAVQLPDGPAHGRRRPSPAPPSREHDRHAASRRGGELSS